MQSLTTQELHCKTALTKTTYKIHILLTLLKFRLFPSSTLSYISTYKTWLYHERDLLVAIQAAFDAPRNIGNLNARNGGSGNEDKERVWMAIKAWMLHQADGKSIEDIEKSVMEMHSMVVSRTRAINPESLTPQQLILLFHLREKYRQHQDLLASLNAQSQAVSKPTITEEQRQESITLGIQGLSILCHHSTALPQGQTTLKKSVLLRHEMMEVDIQEAKEHGGLPYGYKDYSVEEVMWHAEKCGLFVGEAKSCGGTEASSKGKEKEILGNSNRSSMLPTGKKIKEEFDEETEWSIDEEEYDDKTKREGRKQGFDAEVRARQRSTSTMLSPEASDTPESLTANGSAIVLYLRSASETCFGSPCAPNQPADTVSPSPNLAGLYPTEAVIQTEVSESIISYPTYDPMSLDDPPAGTSEPATMEQARVAEETTTSSRVSKSADLSLFLDLDLDPPPPSHSSLNASRRSPRQIIRSRSMGERERQMFESRWAGRRVQEEEVEADEKMWHEPREG